MSYMFFATCDPDAARRFLKEGNTDYMSQELREAVIDAVTNHHFRVCDPRMHGDPTLVYCGKGDPVGEDLEIMERIKALHKRDWKKYSTPTENGVPYTKLSREELLEIAKRPVYENEYQRDYFTSDAADWELTRTFVDFHDDLKESEWTHVFCVADESERENDDYMRRWVETKNVSEFVLWMWGCYRNCPEAFDRISADSLMKHLKNGDSILNEGLWQNMSRKVGERILEVSHTGDPRTLGRIIGMSGHRYTMRDLEALLKGKAPGAVRYDTDSPGYCSTFDVDKFAYGFQTAQEVNAVTLLAVCRLVRKHPTFSSSAERLRALTEREEAKNSVKIQRWLGTLKGRSF